MFNLLFIIVLVVLDGFNYVHNYGAGFSILSGKVDFLIIFTAVALLVIAYFVFAKKFDTETDELCFILILAGGIGNLIDRVVNGYVVDYLEFLFIEFQIFNFAYILICVGVGLFALYTIKTEFFSKTKGDK